jgi:hypothetical protein
LFQFSLSALFQSLECQKNDTRGAWSGRHNAPFCPGHLVLNLVAFLID